MDSADNDRKVLLDYARFARKMRKEELEQVSQ